jgi:hypothetical protein
MAPGVCFCWSIASRAATDRREGHAGERQARHRAGAACESHHRPASMKTTAPELTQVPQAVWQELPPEHVEVELGRADELVQRRGLASARDALGRDGGQQAEPRWCWPAIDPPRGTVWASGCGRQQDAVLLPLQTVLGAFGITQFATEGGRVRAAQRPRAASGGQGEHADNREPPPQAAAPEQAAGPAHHWLCQNDDEARSRAWPLHQSL